MLSSIKTNKSVTREITLKLISDEILIDTGQEKPANEAIYPSYLDYRFWDPAAWTSGHPFALYDKMRENAPLDFGLLLSTTTSSKLSLHTACSPHSAAVSTWVCLIENSGGRKS
jgi:hypothetical protein